MDRKQIRSLTTDPQSHRYSMYFRGLAIISGDDIFRNKGKLKVLIVCLITSCGAGFDVLSNNYLPFRAQYDLN